MLTAIEKERYRRHFILPGFDESAQEKIKSAKALIVGLGGLGSPVSMYLAAAGVGTLGIIDSDIVTESNLQRQILYSTGELGELKVSIAAKKLKALNPYINIIEYPQKLDESNAPGIIGGFDIVVDGTDNFETRYIIDRACSELSIPYVYGSINEFSGQASVFHYKNGRSYRDLFPEQKENECSNGEIGVMGPLPGIIGSIQANETLKIISGLGKVLSGELLLFDALNMSFMTVKI